MPLEIRELHIKVEVNDPTVKSNRSDGEKPATPMQESQQKTDLIRQCVDEIIEIMNNKKER